MNIRIKQIILLLLCAMQLPATSTLDKEVRVTHFTEADGFAECQVSCAIQDHLGYVWIGSWDGLSRYDGYRFKTFKARPGDNCPLKTNRIRWIRELDDHNLECYTSDSCVYVFDRQTGQFRATTADYSQISKRFRPSKELKEKVASIPLFKDVAITILLEDRQGGIWVRSADGLFRVYFTKKAVAPLGRTAQGEQVVRALYVDPKGNLWVGDKGGYLAVFSPDRSLIGYLTPQGSLSKKEVPFGVHVYTILQDSKGDIWLGTKKAGLYRLTPQAAGAYQLRHFMPDATDPYSISSNIVYDLVEDSRHRLWVATYWGGLNMYDLNEDDGKFINRNNRLKGLPTDEESSKVHCLLIPRGGGNTMLVGTHGGLYTCSLDEKPEKMRFFANKRMPSDASSLSNNRVMDFLEAKDGRLFVATYGGGLCVTTSTNLLSEKIPFRHYMTEQGLASDICLNAVSDKDGAVYVVSDMALSKLVPTDSTFTYYMHGLFDTSHFRFSEVSPVLTTDNSLVFGTTQGFLLISPEDIQKSTYVPQIVFDCPDKIDLSSDDKSLVIRFSALDFNKNEHIVYAYKLEGIDPDWTYTTENSIHITNIPSGTYQLHVKSTNGDGAWVDNEATVTIHRPAKFNETPLAWMLYGLLLAVILFFGYKIIRYVRRIERELNELKLSSAEKISFYNERLKELVFNEEKVIDTEVVDDGLTGRERDFAWRMHAFVKDNLKESDLSVDMMASELGVSRTVLYIKTKKVFDTSPNNYVMNMRMEEAMRLLRDREFRVSEVAYKVGFSDPKYFSRCFKKHTGRKPTEFQNSR